MRLKRKVKQGCDGGEGTGWESGGPRGVTEDRVGDGVGVETPGKHCE